MAIKLWWPAAISISLAHESVGFSWPGQGWLVYLQWPVGMPSSSADLIQAHSCVWGWAEPGRSICPAGGDRFCPTCLFHQEANPPPCSCGGQGQAGHWVAQALPTPLLMWQLLVWRWPNLVTCLSTDSQWGAVGGTTSTWLQERGKNRGN